MKLSTKKRNDVLATLKAGLRGKKGQWHCVRFEYYGYFVNARLNGVHADIINISVKGGSMIKQSMPYSVSTIKASVEYFGEVMDWIDMHMQEAYKADRMNKKDQLEYILHFDPLGVL